ncbi:Inosine-5'-monophosphate dehydrogenase [archaeon HR06]|nr:Inosine-5'-monophosphate dehydrogenase [archaeon HR06]
MDTVTESAMAIAMARAGGIGIIHRFLPIEQQVKEIVKVKRSESILIEKPVTISPDKTIKEAKELMKQYGIGGIVVIDENQKVIGIITTRDVKFEDREDLLVKEVMTKDVITAPFGTTIEEAKEILKVNKIEKLPIVDEFGKLKGLITAKDITKREEYPEACKDSKGRLRVGAAIGVKGDYLERAEALIQAECDVLVVDIAHGHSDLAIRAVSKIKEKFDKVEVIAGNVATAQGTKDLIDAGVDGVKVGVGSGSICITRIVTGAGVPQLTAIMDCAKVGHEYDIPIIADGGIRNSGDITKALAAGASSVMIGSLLAGTDESPGITIIRPDGRYKMSRGMASLTATIDRRVREGSNIDEAELLEYVPEGVEAMVPYKGKTMEIISKLVGGLRSGMSYCGASNIKELWEKAEFILVSEASYKEGLPHDVKLIY